MIFKSLCLQKPLQSYFWNHKNVGHVMPAGAFGAVRPVGAITPTATAAGPSHSRSHRRLRRFDGPCRPVMFRWCFPRYHRWLWQQKKNSASPSSQTWPYTKKGLWNESEASSVEIDGVEPTTLCLQSRCSSQLSYIPKICRPEQIWTADPHIISVVL